MSRKNVKGAKYLATDVTTVENLSKLVKILQLTVKPFIIHKDLRIFSSFREVLLALRNLKILEFTQKMTKLRQCVCCNFKFALFSEN